MVTKSSKRIGRVLPCQSCADVSEMVAMAFPCQSCALLREQARRARLRLVVS